MAECNSEGVVITPPKDPTLIERLGYEEIELSKTDVDDNTITAVVVGRLEES